MFGGSQTPYGKSQQQPQQQQQQPNQRNFPRARSSLSGPTTRNINQPNQSQLQAQSIRNTNPNQYPTQNNGALQSNQQQQRSFINTQQNQSVLQQQRQQAPPGDSTNLTQYQLKQRAVPNFDNINGNQIDFAYVDFSNDAKQKFNDSFLFFPDDVVGTSGFSKPEQNVNTGNSCLRCFITLLVWIFVIFTFPFTFWWYFNVIYEYERAIVFRMGAITTVNKSVKSGSTGVFFTLPCIEEYRKVDMRTTCVEFPAQDVLTRDNITVKVDGVVYYRVYNPVLAVTQVVNPHISTSLLAQSLLRNAVAYKNFENLIALREMLADELCSSLQAVTAGWGVRIEKVFIKNFSFSPEIQRALAAGAESTRQAKAKLVAAEGEKAAARTLKEAADVISSSPTALQLRYIQAISDLSGRDGSTVVVPLPVDLLGNFFNGNNRGNRTNFPCPPGIVSGFLPTYDGLRRMDRGVGNDDILSGFLKSRTK